MLVSLGENATAGFMVQTPWYTPQRWGIVKYIWLSDADVFSENWAIYRVGIGTAHIV